MRNLVGVLAVVLTILLLAPGLTQADPTYNAEKKFAIDLRLGAGVYTMVDLNDYLPETEFLSYPGKDDDQINFGTQVGFGFGYRIQENFGWMFGFNFMTSGVPAIMEGKYRKNAFYPQAMGAESWVEQTVSGSELYILPTWYFGWGENKELSLSAGPAIYRASLDRTISIVRTAGSNANPSGSFTEAKGTALGWMLVGGLEIPMKKSTDLLIQVGGRIAKVDEIAYKDQNDVENTVWMNTSSNATMAVDFSGAFLTVGIRTYFASSEDWRNLR